MEALARCNRWFLCFLYLTVALAASVTRAQSLDERRLVELTNASRSEAGLPPLKWDAALAAAARAHALRMATEGPIAHRYGGEADLPERAALAGAHFSLIEENIAVGTTSAQIHEGWMQSPGHHDNLLNPKIDRIGVALIPSHGLLYAVADYAAGVEQLTLAQVEDKVGKVLLGRGLTLVSEASGAREYCALQEGDAGSGLGIRARFLMRWQSADIAKLPADLERALASGRYKQASVGACAPQGDVGGKLPVFSQYRAAVLLY